MASANPNDGDQKKNVEEFDLDTVDGFKGCLRKALKKLMCTDISETNNYGSTLSNNSKETETDVLNKNQEKASIEFDWDDDTYDFTYPKRGLAVIINNIDFKAHGSGLSDRGPSEIDGKSLKKSFERQGFNVIQGGNLAAWQIIEFLDYTALYYNHANSDCFACAILTHGLETIIESGHLGEASRIDLLCGTDDKVVATKAVVEKFNDLNCPGLRNKPRLFFFQACRGGKHDPGQTILDCSSDEPTFTLHQDKKDGYTSKEDMSLSYDTTDADLDEDKKKDKNKGSKDRKAEYIRMDESGDKKNPSGTMIPDVSNKNPPISSSPLYEDCLIMYATPPGYSAYLRGTGSWFIQSLCKVFDSGILKSTPLHCALTKVCRLTADYKGQSDSKPELNDKKQVPVIESMLVKDVFFKPKAAGAS